MYIIFNAYLYYYNNKDKSCDDIVAKLCNSIIIAVTNMQN